MNNQTYRIVQGHLMRRAIGRDAIGGLGHLEEDEYLKNAGFVSKWVAPLAVALNTAFSALPAQAIVQVVPLKGLQKLIHEDRQEPEEMSKILRQSIEALQDRLKASMDAIFELLIHLSKDPKNDKIRATLILRLNDIEAFENSLGDVERALLNAERVTRQGDRLLSDEKMIDEFKSHFKSLKERAKQQRDRIEARLRSSNKDLEEERI